MSTFNSDSFCFKQNEDEEKNLKKKENTKNASKKIPTAKKYNFICFSDVTCQVVVIFNLEMKCNNKNNNNNITLGQI